MYKKTKNHIEDTMKFILIYSYCTELDDGEIALNQKSIGAYLGLTKMTMIRHFSKIKDLGLISIVDKTKFTTHKKSMWYSNLYSVDQEAINTYILKKTGYDVLANLENESKKYYEFMTFVKLLYNERRLEDLSEEEKEVEIKKIRNKEISDKKKVNKLKKDNKFYLDLLKEVNNNIIHMNYLDENRKRLTNSLCVTRNPEVPGHEKDKVRFNMLTNFFDNCDSKDIIEYDTNASIYRLSYALGNGHLASHDEDIYKLVFDACNFENIEWTKELRDKFKGLLMPIYMKESSIEYTCNEFEKHCRWKYFISKEVKKRFLFYKYFVDTFKMNLRTILNIVRQAMHKVFNLEKFYKAEIFIYESNLHIIMLKLFKDLDIKTIDVYDGFYFLKNTMDANKYNNIYDKAILILLNNINNKKPSLNI